jgi:hypothetical protein
VGGRQGRRMGSSSTEAYASNENRVGILSHAYGDQSIKNLKRYARKPILFLIQRIKCIHSVIYIATTTYFPNTVIPP